MISSVFEIRCNGFFVVLAVIIMAFGVIGCGKKTMPKPPAEVSFFR
ncbi:MAG: hypothetical protein AAB210_00495 [Deltaproteobacteria bacterium]